MRPQGEVKGLRARVAVALDDGDGPLFSATGRAGLQE